MKKRILLLMMVVFTISMTACGGKKESESSINDVSQTSAVAEKAEVSTTESATAATEDGVTGKESAADGAVDYSGAKAQIEALDEKIDGYTNDLIKKDDKNASWIMFGSNSDYEHGGGYGGNWAFYVVNEETKQYDTMGKLYDNYPKTDDKMAYDAGMRIGNGTYKLYVVYRNDEKGVYFYAEDEVVIDDTTLQDYKDKKCVVYDVTDLVGEDFTAMTFQLERE